MIFMDLLVVKVHLPETVAWRWSKNILKNFAKFTGSHLRQSLFYSIEYLGTATLR